MTGSEKTGFRVLINDNEIYTAMPRDRSVLSLSVNLANPDIGNNNSCFLGCANADLDSQNNIVSWPNHTLSDGDIVTIEIFGLDSPDTPSQETGTE